MTPVATMPRGRTDWDAEDRKLRSEIADVQRVLGRYRHTLRDLHLRRRELEYDRRLDDILARAEQGQTFAEIGRVHDLSRQRVHELVANNDPELLKRRRREEAEARHKARLCPSCGTYRGPRAEPGRHCRACAKPGPRQRWNRELIVARIREWAAEYGHAPTATEWNPAAAREDLQDEYRARFHERPGYWPYSATVIRHWGSWGAAINAAEAGE